MRLLIVEDSPEMRRLMKRMLADLAEEVAECDDGSEALQAYTCSRPDWVLSEQERLRRVMDPATDIEEFRRELYDYFTEMEDAMRLFNEVPAVREKFNQAGFHPLAMLAGTKQKLSELKPEELSQMRATYAKFPGWREFPRSINLLIKPQLRQRLESRVAAKKSSGDIQPNAVTPDNCADGIAADISNTDIAAAETAVIAADAIMEALPTDFVTILAREASVAIRAALKGTALALTTLKAIKDDCTSLDAATVQGIVTNSTNTIVANNNTNKDTILNSLTSAKNEIINNDNSNKTMITTTINNAQTSINNTSNANSTAILTSLTTAKNEIVNNNNSNKTMIVNNDNANTAALTTSISNAQTTVINSGNANKNELRDLLLRTQIEADLAEADNATPVALYLTPTANGGYLNLVQTIVTETLANIRAAGGSIGDAQSFLNQANADKAAGRFKDAYKNYRKAYKAAAN